MTIKVFNIPFRINKIFVMKDIQISRAPRKLLFRKRIIRFPAKNSASAHGGLGIKRVTWLLHYATQEANSDKWMKTGGRRWKPGADRNMWQRLGGYPKAIVGRNPSGARERREGDPSLKRGKRGWREKRIPTPPSSTPLPPRGGFRTGGPIGGRTFLQRSLTKRP